MLIFAIVVTIGPNHNNFFLPNLSAKYPAGVFTHNLAAANALRIEPICAPDRCNSVLANDGMVGAKIPCPIAHANERQEMERISLLSLRKFEGTIFDDPDDVAVVGGEGTVFDDPDIAVVGGRGRGDGVGIFGDFFFVFRPPVFLSSSSAVEEENKAFSTTPVQNNSSSRFVFVFAEDTTALRNILLLDVNDTNTKRFVLLHLVSLISSLSRKLFFCRQKLSLFLSARRVSVCLLCAQIECVCSKNHDNTREKENETLTTFRQLLGKKNVQKAKERKQRRKSNNTTKPEREREKRDTHTHTHTRVHKLVFEIFVVSFTPHFGWTRDPLGNERRGKEGTRIVVIYKHTYTHRHTHTHKRERERA